jgi:exopolyphosphatase/pppGpp-phosphohydrolase
LDILVKRSMEKQSFPKCTATLLYLFLAATFAWGADPERNQLQDTGLVCAVDMGSNTFKFIISEIKNGKYLQYADVRKTAGVGDDLRFSERKTGHKQISEAKLKEVKALLMGFQDECEQRTGTRKLNAIATAAFREAENIRMISEQLLQQQIEMKVLSAEEESAYAYEAATLGVEGFAVTDLGSRTTEFVIKNGEQYRWAEIPIGYKVAWDEYYEKSTQFHQAADAHLQKLKELIGEKEKAILNSGPELVMIEVGETSSYILGIPQGQIEGKVITRDQIQKKLKDLHVMTVDSFTSLKKEFKDAAKVLPRLVFIDFLLAQTNHDRFIGTDRELNVAIIYRISRSSSKK